MLGGLGLIGLLYWLGPVNRIGPHPYYAGQGFEVIAHGAGQGLRPKNTLEAAQFSATLGADAIELDIHATSEGILVVRHDDTVDATTNGSGQIRLLTLEELKRLDAGYWHSQGEAYPFREQGIRIPALEELFTALPDARFLIEIKPDSERIAGDLCALINQFGLQSQVMVASFHDKALKAFRQTCPQVASAMTKSEITWFVLLDKIGLSHLLPVHGLAMQVPVHSGAIDVVTPSLVKAAHRRGIRVQVWTINETDEMAELIEIGVDGIVTDFPDRLIRLKGRVSG
ncbi:glycerophosphodiester phosphodiesterase [Bowmanella dokdonensis]|nr:glycerophosphodiester phosphodiesterase [Bowmanella dokdonensis]